MEGAAVLGVVDTVADGKEVEDAVVEDGGRALSPSEECSVPAGDGKWPGSAVVLRGWSFGRRCGAASVSNTKRWKVSAVRGSISSYDTATLLWSVSQSPP